MDAAALGLKRIREHHSVMEDLAHPAPPLDLHHTLLEDPLATAYARTT